MAFDGITIAAMVQELHNNLDNGRFNKTITSFTTIVHVINFNFPFCREITRL